MMIYDTYSYALVPRWQEYFRARMIWRDLSFLCSHRDAARIGGSMGCSLSLLLLETSCQMRQCTTQNDKKILPTCFHGSTSSSSGPNALLFSSLLLLLPFL